MKSESKNTRHILWHSRTPEEVLGALQSSSSGLSPQEAEKRLSEFGYNELEAKKRISPIRVLLNQFKNVLILILIGASVVSYFIGESVDSLVILAIVLAVAVLGFVQEYRAEKALEALKKMAALTATVVRADQEREIPAREAVPGDLILVEAGYKVPADARLIEAVNLRVDEASLSGESEPVDKTTQVLAPETSIVDRTNIIYTGTTVVYGRGKAVVFSTGPGTEFGKVALLMEAAEAPKTPLEVRMQHVGRFLGGIMLVVSASVVALGVLRGYRLLEMFLWGVSLAVAAVPEALPAVVTGGLAMGVRRMARRNAIVRRLPAVETLGSTTVICSDKTGTMTKGEMTVRRLYTNGTTYEATGSGYGIDGKIIGISGSSPEEAIHLLTKIGILCNDAKLSEKEAIGDPTEISIIVAGIKAGHSQEALTETYPRIGEVPFSSEKKRMITVHETPDKQLLVCMKGAPEAVLEKCASVYQTRRPIKLDPASRSQILTAAESLAREALRVLAFAYKPLPAAAREKWAEECEDGLVFAGLMGMLDPPREEVRDAIRKCNEAGIKVIMITGDHKLTAQAVAKELGLNSSGQVLTGNELDSITDQAFSGIVESVTVFARVSPEHKIRIVKALKAKGHVVAMTGDGVNDAPALKNADIGVAMGITGTDVTKEAADMVLVDDNFTSIVAAVEEGRSIHDNIKKYLLYLLSANVGEIILMFAASLLGLPLPLLPVQILYVNLATDGLPALALGLDPTSKDVMRRPPHPPGESIFKGIKSWIAVVSVQLAGSMLLIYIWGLGHADLVEARALCFAALIIFELAFSFSCRSQRYNLFQIGAVSNKYLVLAVAWELGLLSLIFYVPFLRMIFDIATINMVDFVVVGFTGLSGFLLAEMWKSVTRTFRRVSPTGF